jgi:ABC-type branched-subunit amino acid transport system substrate-binding protein
MRAREKKSEVRSQKSEVGLPYSVFCLLSSVFCLLLSACSSIRPVVKIALIAPFEGRYRNVGYEVIYAVRLAVREANAAGGVAGYSVELLALDDSGDEGMAVEQARKVAADPQVLGAIGHWLGGTTAAAAPIYDAEGIPFLESRQPSAISGQSSAFRLGLAQGSCPSDALCPESVEHLRQWEAEGQTIAPNTPIILPAPLPADSTAPDFAKRYRAISNGTEPSFNAVLAYDAANLLFDAIARAAKANGSPTRAGVMETLAHSAYAGLSGPIRFDEQHNRKDAAGWIYAWQEGLLIRP